jgi:hypothetical protein
MDKNDSKAVMLNDISINNVISMREIYNKIYFLLH